MSFQLSVADELTRYLNPQAVTESHNRLQTYAEDLLREAGRLETVSSTTGGDPEITSSMVADADLLLRRGYRQVPRNWGLTLGKIVAPVGALLTGVLADVDKLKDPLLLIIFVLLLIVTVTATVLVVVKD